MDIFFYIQKMKLLLLFIVDKPSNVYMHICICIWYAGHITNLLFFDSVTRKAESSKTICIATKANSYIPGFWSMTYCNTYLYWLILRKSFSVCLQAGVLEPRWIKAHFETKKTITLSLKDYYGSCTQMPL